MTDKMTQTHIFDPHTERCLACGMRRTDVESPNLPKRRGPKPKVPRSVPDNRACTEAL